MKKEIEEIKTANGGSLPSHTIGFNSGGYPLFYVIKGQAICAKCADKDIEDVEIYDINWESDDLYCDSCSERIEPAYAE